MSDPHRLAIDIGSTVIKLAFIDPAGQIDRLVLQDRDLEQGIADQVESLLEKVAPSFAEHGANMGHPPLICSSAKGGLRIGILALTERFSGAHLRNQALGAGANPVYVLPIDDPDGNPERVDILLIGGGIDCPDAKPMERRLACFDPARYTFETLIYAGNRYLRGHIQRRYPDTRVIDNPMVDRLEAERDSVARVLRRAYLDNLIHKEGISRLRADLATGVRPTPERVNLGLKHALCHRSSIEVVPPCLLIDIGGATTDLHYTVELIRDDSPERPQQHESVTRYVFIDLGVVHSRANTLLRLRQHPRLFDLLSLLEGEHAREIYRLMHDGAYEPTQQLLAYACLFQALTRFSRGDGPGLPTAELDRVEHLILTGGAAQGLDETKIQRIFALCSTGSDLPKVAIDRDYRFWVDGFLDEPVDAQ